MARDFYFPLESISYDFMKNDKKVDIVIRMSLLLYPLTKKGRNGYRTCISSCMKRTNPNTNEPFKYGDVRNDGYRFYNYKTRVKSDGFHAELWLSPDSFKKAETRDRYLKHKKRRQDGKPTRMTRGKKSRLNAKEESSFV